MAFNKYVQLELTRILRQMRPASSGERNPACERPEVVIHKLQPTTADFVVTKHVVFRKFSVCHSACLERWSLAVMELVMYFQQGFSVSEMINLPFPTIELVPVLAFMGYFYWKKSKCKPIYDRWVHQHGTDPDKWPPAPNSDRTSEKRTKSESPSKLEKYGFVAVIILAVAVIAYSNLKYGWFEWLEDSRFR